jgi:adenylate cyclase
MRITYSYQGKEQIFERDTSQVIAGRPSQAIAVDLDLRPDQAVSRPHARIWVDGGKYWIEDLNSLRGTLIGAENIKGKGRRQLSPGDIVRIGDTTLRVHIPSETSADHTAPLAAAAPTRPPLEIAAALDASMAPFMTVETPTPETARRLALLYELPFHFAAEKGLDRLLQTIVERLVEVIPDAARGAVLLRDRGTDTLLLKAYVSPGQPAVSETLARRAMTEGKGFIWRRREGADVGVTILQNRIETGMYAPVLWQGEALGVICVDNPERDSTFTDGDWHLMLAVAQYAALALANHQLQEKLRRETELKAALLRQFSPKVAERLMGQHGRPRLASQRGEVTILCSDVRGFTRLSQGMEPDDVVEMLNAYLAQLTPVIFKWDGTVDKYAGDSILAVFGSPEPDPKHVEKAVQAAVEMQAALGVLNTGRKARGQVTFGIGIGVHCGEVVHGFIGPPERRDFTIIGDAVNRASRYCDGAKVGEVLISPEVHSRVWKVVQAQPTTITTKHEGALPAFRVTGFQHPIPS